MVGEIADSLTYSPVRANNVRTSLRNLPTADYSGYTFIDIGSGKGRVLFVAAEFPFRKIIGVEFDTPIHQHALQNIKRYRGWGRKCSTIESINANAAEFEFPNENLVIYLCNPFGPEIMARMLANLAQSLDTHPRHVVMILLWPERSRQIAEMRHMKPYELNRRFHIYQTANPGLRS